MANATITDEQIETLRKEADAAADYVMVKVCDVALKRVNVRTLADADLDELACVGVTDRASARAKCALVIANTSATYVTQ